MIIRVDLLRRSTKSSLKLARDIDGASSTRLIGNARYLLTRNIQRHGGGKTCLKYGAKVCNKPDIFDRVTSARQSHGDVVTLPFRYIAAQCSPTYLRKKSRDSKRYDPLTRGKY